MLLHFISSLSTQTMKIIIPVLLLCCIAGIYTFHYIKSHIGLRLSRFIYIAASITTIVYALIYLWGENYDAFAIFKAVAMVVIFYSSITLPIAIIGAAEDIYRLYKRHILHRPIPSRKRGIFVIGIVLSAIGCSILLLSILHTKTHWKVHHVDIYSSRLPVSMDSMRVVQISDLHLGSFDIHSRDSIRISKAMDIINSLHPDIILFTGDIVNGNSSEMKPWVEILSKTYAPYGKYAVMGNHDYATYERYFSLLEKENSIKNIKEYYHSAGYKILDNENVAISIGNDSIYIAGVENWGRGPFPALGDIDAALDGIDNDKFTILLSHDPSHYEDIVSSHPQMVDITLSGHTHAMQFGIEINDRWRWSPVKYVYKYWAGLYEENGRMLYVNRGLGYHFFPARVGIRPEITLFTLHRKE